MNSTQVPLNVLVFSRTTGYRHEAINVAVPAIQKLDESFHIDATEDSAVFTPENLAKYQVVVFMMTTGNLFDADQKEAIEAYVRNGGGFIAIHSAIDTEYEWPFYGELVGAYFLSHPQIQEGVVHLEDANHPTTSMMPKEWKRADEWYDLRENPRGKVHVLATLDGSTYEGSKMTGDHPIIWCHEVGQGRSWVNLFGHTDETWVDETFLASLRAAVRWVARA